MRVFARVVEAGAFPRAADQLQIPRPNLSAKLRVFVDWVVEIFEPYNTASVCPPGNK